MARPEVGKVGVSLSNLREMEILFDGIDLAKISTSFTINGTAAIIYAMYLALADKAGVPRAKLTGTIQNDILKEYRRARDLDLSGAAVDAPGCGFDPLREYANAALQSHQHRGCARARRGMQRGRRDGVTRSPTASPMSMSCWLAVAI